MFRKILSSAKNKVKTPKIKFKKGNEQLEEELAARSDEFERKKQEWQDELEEKSEFLYIKSANEQKEEGVSQPLDTAFIEEKDGLPFLKCVFDVKYFKKEDIHLDVEDNQLVLQARTTEDGDDRIYTRTIIRKLDLPKHADPKMMRCDIKNGVLSIEMPFHLPPQKKPAGPNVFPIITDGQGNRKIRLMMFIGTDFTPDDVKVETNGKSLKIRAAYDEEIGKYGRQVTQREFNREYQLPDHLDVDHVTQTFSPDGRLFIEIYLKCEKAFKVEITSEDIDDIQS